MKTKKKATKKTSEQYAIIANRSYGLFCGIVESHDPGTGQGDGVVVARSVRHIAQWFGRTGGITSLAAHGLCGSRAGESRIGAACPRAKLSGIVNVFDCTPEARATLEAATQK